MDLARFEPHHTGPAYVEARGRQNYIEVYDIIHPLQPMEQPRPLRTSPFHPRQVELGARFLEGGGWERPHWYEANAGLPGVADTPGRGPWASRYWSPIAGAEALATRAGVALYDLTPLTRIAVTGPGAAAFLQRMTTNDVDRPAGTVVYTLMLDERGGIRSDLTVARLAPDRFQLGANGRLDLDWLLRHAPTDGSVHIDEVTAGTCCLGVWGPRARDLLARVTRADLTNDAFRYFRARQITVGHVPVTALRVSYVGELGWELYTTADHGLALWDTVWAAGEDLGVIAAGRSAFASLRLEKGYRLWGVDMTTDDDPWEAGLGWVVKPGAGDFIGRAALEGRGDATARRRLVPLVLDDAATVVMGREPVWLDGRPAGYVTSAAFGPTIGRSIAYAWLPPGVGPGTRVEVETFGECVGARVESEPLFDPDGTRLRA
jgi:glycine cleavage system aminomethyltransferase T